MEVIRIILVVSFVTLGSASWYPLSQDALKMDPNQKSQPNVDSSLVNLAKKVDEIYGDQTARLICQQALTNHIVQSVKGSSTSTPQPDIAARIGLDDYYSMIPSVNQLQTLGYITNAIGQTRQTVQKIMSVFGY